jgi:methyltransferase-like protein/trans-aconitate methyltransferase
LNPATAAQARVLELGCGDGGNLLSLAQALPGASFVGIDAAAGAIARGSELARAAGLENVQLRQGDLEELPEAEGLGGFDYVIAHGVYSWIAPRARVGLLAGVRRHMAAEGVAYVSYNAYPGSYLRDMARDILDYHVRKIDDPQARLEAAQSLMATVVAIEEPSPYAQVLREHMERMLAYPDALLLHDDLAEISTPFYFHEFMQHATHHRLAFLSEANLFESQLRDVPDSAERLMEGLADDVVVREQYLDFFKNRMFRQTLLCHADAPVSRELDERQVERFTVCSQVRAQEHEGGDDQDTETFITPDGFSLTTSEPLVRAAMHALAQAWPEALDFPTLLDAATEAVGDHAPRELVAARLRTVLLQAYLARIVILQTTPPPLHAQPGEHPRASPLARAQAAAGLPVVSSLLHANARLEGELEPRLLALLDGTRDRDALMNSLPRAGGDASDGGNEIPPMEIPATPAQVEEALERFASLGLLQTSFIL